MTATSVAGIRVVCVLGPTAAGKTQIACELVREFDLEIISVDSAQIYRGMDIGTAKPTPAELAEFPHRLIDIRDPWESYSAAEFCTDAAVAIREIHALGRVPLLVGGTMLYFQALQQGLADLPSADESLRRALDKRAATEGWEALHAELATLDPVAAARLKPTDRQRIQRALEICLLTGEPASVLQQNNRRPIEAEYLNIGLIPADRSALHARLAQRLEVMRAAGLLAEVRALSELPGMHADVPAMRSVGYRQLWQCVAGELAEDEASAKALVATRRLAKRQMTWLRSWPNLNVIDSFAPDAMDKARSLVREWLTNRASGLRNR
jgi:tRNA dimethylallyltransferase